MKLKLDDNGNVVVQDGKPVYIHDDGQEMAFDAPSALSKIGDLNAESAKHRRAAKDLKTQLSAFEGLDAGKAREALNVVQNLDDKKLVDAGEIDKIKTSLAESFNTEKTKLQDELANKDAKIRKLTVSSQFAQSDFLQNKTVLTPDIAESAFGKYFEVEESDKGFQVVAKLNDLPIYSKEKPGEPASFDEAISTIINSRPDKDRLLRSPGHGGSGAQGGRGTGNGTTNPFRDGTVTEQAALVKSDPNTARRLAREAGKEIPGLTDT